MWGALGAVLSLVCGSSVAAPAGASESQADRPSVSVEELSSETLEKSDPSPSPPPDSDQVIERRRTKRVLGPRGSGLRSKRVDCTRFWETRRYEKAAACWREVVDAGATDPFAIRILAYSLFYSNQLEHALHYFDQALARRPKSDVSLKGKGLVSLALGQNESAAETFRRAIELEPGDDAYHRLYGVALQRQGRLEEALAAYNEALRLRPKSSAAWTVKGSVLFKLARYTEAMKAFDKIIEINPAVAGPWRNKGSCLVAAGKPKEALAMFDVALEIDPVSVRSWYNRGVAQERLGDLDEARRHYQRAIQIDPDYSEATRALEGLKAGSGGRDTSAAP